MNCSATLWLVYRSKTSSLLLESADSGAML
jgi:hypothetical protein